MNENEMNQNIGNSGEEKMEPIPEEGSIGAVVGSVIVVIILIVAGFYLWNSRVNTPPAQPVTQVPVVPAQETPAATTEDPATKALAEQSAAVDLSSIEQDLNTTDLNGLDKEMGDIGTETGL